MSIPTLAEADLNPKAKIERDADRGERFIEMYDKETGSDGSSLTDLLADLMHWVDSLSEDDREYGPGSFELALVNAESNYEAEKEGSE